MSRSLWKSRLPGMFTVDGNPAKGRTMKELEEALRAEIERLKSEPVSESELDRVRNQVIAGKVYEKDSVFYQAMQIGVLETIGLDWRLADEYVDRLGAVTAEQVQAVARKYLTDERLTVAVLEPLPISADKPRRAVSGDRHAIN